MLKSPQFKEFLLTVRQQQERIARDLDETELDLAPRWESLRSCCARLECLSHKQLRGREFALEEQRFLGQYGRSLARIMMYEGNSYQTPRDDAPRIVDVFANKGQVLEVGIGKPRAMYVLYPWHGSEILCRGAVLPYYEFVHKERLTDTAWRDLLQTEGRPAQPAWTKVLTDGPQR